MSKTAYQKTALTGGGGTALDGIDGAGLLDGDFAYVMVSGTMYVYILNATSGAAESSPDIIAPDTNAGNKRWILQRHVQATTAAAGVTVYSGSTKARAGTDTASAMTPEDVSTAISPIVRLNNQGIAMTAATSGSNGIVVADNDNINFGTGNFTIWFDGLAPDWTPSSAIVLMQKWSSNVGYELGVNTSGYVTLKLNTTTYTSSVANTFTDGTRHKIGAVVTVGASNTTVDFYVDGRPLGTQQTAANPGTVSNSANLYVLGTSSTRTAGAAFGAFTFNRALTASEALDLYRNGINYADKWGSQTAVYTSNFSAGVDSWGGGEPANMILTGNTSIAGEDDWIKVERINTTGRCDISHSGLVTASDGKKRRILVKIHNPAGSALQYFNVFLGGLNAVQKSTTTISVPADSSVMAIVEGPYSTIGNNTSLYVSPTDSSGEYIATVAAGQIYYVKSISLYLIGATLALEQEGIQPAPGQWLDSSSNKLHAMQPATGSSLTRYKKDFEFRWTNTWTASSAAQYVGGLNQAVLSADHFITSIVTQATVTTDVENLTLGDGSDADRFVTAFAPSATRTSQTIANQNDGTNLKLVYTPAAEATMTVETIIRGFIWEP